MKISLFETVAKYNKIVILTHKNPDGDTLGSASALYEYLKFFMQKKVYIYNPSIEIPRKFDIIPHYKVIKNIFPEGVDCVISVDCGDIQRTEIEKSNEYFWINIDHHKSNNHYGDINIIDIDAPSNTVVIFNLFQEHNIQINKPMATALYTGLISDTDNLIISQPDYGERALEIVDSLVRSGAIDLIVIDSVAALTPKAEIE